MADIRIHGLVENSLQWPLPDLKRHHDAAHPINKMQMLLDFCLDGEDDCIQLVVEKILAHKDENHAFLSTILIPKAFGGSDQPELNWLICDFPLLLHFLIRAGNGHQSEVEAEIEMLANLADENGCRYKGAIPKYR